MNVSLINYGLVYVESMRTKWIDQAAVTKLDVYDITPTLVEIYKIFLVLLLPIDNILQNPKLMSIPIQLFNIFRDPDWFNALVKNLLAR